jgi:histidine ammonia-lyase
MSHAAIVLCGCPASRSAIGQDNGATRSNQPCTGLHEKMRKRGTLSIEQSQQQMPISVGIGALSMEDVIAVARHGAKVAIDERAQREMALSRAIIEDLAGDTVPHYGISTGFGALASTSIPREQRSQLQKSLIRSHAAGAGPEVEREVVRALLALRLSTLCTGRTGVRPETAQVYADMLNAGITPVVYEYGSLGCSGDLAPLAACALVAMGEGEAYDASGRKVSGGKALADAGITPVDFKEKEGLALVNGTDGMLGMLCMAIADLRLLLKTADIAAAMSVEGMLGNDRVFAADLQSLRPHKGQAAAAANIAAMLHGSGLIEAGRPGATVRVQDAYSLRCTPQVHGAARDTVEYAASVANIELGSAIDNPCVTLDGRVESNGNFHGAPLAYVLDFLAIPTADAASISERRTDRFLDTSRNRGLPAFLAGDPGVDSGLMIAQYTAAGMVSEMKRNAVPASVDSIPSSAMQEDHVSMGWAAARKLRRSIPAFARVLAIELICSARSYDFRKPYQPGAAGAAVYRVVRESAGEVGPERRDIWTTPQIEGVAASIMSGEVLAAAQSAVGALR